MKFYSQASFNLLYANQLYPIYNAKGFLIMMKSVSRIWIEWSHRRTYHDLKFAPGMKVRPDELNMFTGWGMKPQAGGSCEKLQYHLRSVVCGGDDHLYRWLTSWFAHCLQKPEEKPGTAVVLRGKKGTGKTTVSDAFVRIIGRNHTMVVDKTDQLIGRFNKHLATALFVQVEEAFWAGQKDAEGAFKSVITSTRLPFEGKGTDIIMLDSYHRFLMTTNADWAVPATADERRFCVIDVQDFYMQDTAYFEALNLEMNNAGGLEAWMHFLLEWKIPDDIDLRNPPKTAALGLQVLESMPLEKRFFIDRLISGEGLCEDRESTIVAADLFEDFKEYVGNKYSASRQKFGRLVSDTWGVESSKEWYNGGTKTVYKIEPLPELKDFVAEKFGFERWMLDG